MRALAVAAALFGAAAMSLSPGLDAAGRAVAVQTTDPAASVLVSRVRDLVEEAITAHQMPGAVVVAGHGDQVLGHEACGARALEPAREAMTVDTIFDAA